MKGCLPFMYLSSPDISPCMDSRTAERAIKRVVRVHTQGRTVWGNDHNVNLVLCFIVWTTRKRLYQMITPGNLCASILFTDPVEYLLWGVIARVCYLEINSL